MDSSNSNLSVVTPTNSTGTGTFPLAQNPGEEFADTEQSEESTLRFGTEWCYLLSLVYYVQLAYLASDMATSQLSNNAPFPEGLMAVLALTNLVSVCNIWFSFVSTSHVGFVVVGLTDPERHLVRSKYMWSWMVVDVLLSLPLDIILYNSANSVSRGLSLARFLAVFRVYDLITRVPFYRRYTRMLYAFVTLILFVHIGSCSYVGFEGSSYVQALRDMICVACMVSVQSHPATSGGKATIITFSLVMTVGYVLFAASVIQSCRDQGLGWARIMHELMYKHDVPMSLQRGVMENYHMALSRPTINVKDELEMLSPAMHRAVFKEIKLKLLKKPTMMKQLGESCREALAAVMNYHEFEPNEIVVRKDAAATSLFWLVNGMLEAVQDNMEPIMRISGGAWFGEQCLSTPDSIRVVTVIAVTHAMLLSLDRADVHGVAMRYPVLHRVVLGLNGSSRESPSGSMNASTSKRRSGESQGTNPTAPHTPSNRHHAPNRKASSPPSGGDSEHDTIKRRSTNPIRPFVPMGHGMVWKVPASGPGSEHDSEDRPRMSTFSEWSMMQNSEHRGGGAGESRQGSVVSSTMTADERRHTRESS
eukprot:PhF_6_TR19021/c0_g1_i1/m.27897